MVAVEKDGDLPLFTAASLAKVMKSMVLEIILGRLVAELTP
jgi:hypothetical protein